MKAKNIGLLATLAMVVTVGGVYATWNYATGDIDNTTANVSVEIAGTGESKKGTIAATSTLKLIVDDGGSFVPTITWSGKIDVTFTAGAGYDSNDKIDLEYTVAITTNGEYQEKDVFKTDGNTYDFASDLNDTNNTASITSLSGVSIEDFTLPTLTDYNNFKTAITNAKFTVTISEK